MQKSVKEDREKYIGGSDIPIIMGISPFKSRFDLLLEKAELKDNDFDGNEYTEYGNTMEPKIREHINASLGKDYKEGKHILDDIRIHTDGECQSSILEIKTTSQIHDDVDGYKVYLVQLLFYMYHTKKTSGVLAVYNRPEDFSEEFDKDRLQVFMITIDNYKDLVEEINKAVDQFRIDLEKVKENPLITEEDLLPVDIKSKAELVVELENKLAEYKAMVEEYDKAKAELKTAMETQGLKKWTTPNGTQITLVLDTPDKEVEEEYYDEDKFIAENKELHEQYHNKLAEYKGTKTVIKKGKKGYVKITLPKGDNDETTN